MLASCLNAPQADVYLTINIVMVFGFGASVVGSWVRANEPLLPRVPIHLTVSGSKYSLEGASGCVERSRRGGCS